MANKFIIEVRSKGFKGTSKDLDKVTKKTKEYTKASNKLRGTTAGLRRTIGALRNNLLLVSFAFGTVALAIKKVVDTAAGFEAVKTRLVGLTGSVKKAEAAFSTFNQVAATTPFSLQDVVEAGAQLQAFGANAESMIKPITDLAAFMGTTATEAANAFGRAYAGGAGAADIFREKGILNIIKSSQGLADLSKTTLPEFREALINAIQDPTVGIAGSTDRMAKTFVGAFSNMQDSVIRLAAEIGDTLLPSIKNATVSIGGLADELREFIHFARFGHSELDIFSDEVKMFGASLKGLSTDELGMILGQLEADLPKATQKSIQAVAKAADEIKNVEGTINDIDLSKPFELEINTDAFIGPLEEGIIRLGDAVDRDLTSEILGITDIFKTVQAEAEATGGLTIPIDTDILKEKIEMIKEMITGLNEAAAAELAQLAALLQEKQMAVQQGAIDMASSTLSMWQTNINARMKAELDGLKATESYQNADAKQRKKMEKEITEDFRAEKMIQFRLTQAASIADVWMSAAVATMKAIAAFPLTFGQPWVSIIQGLAAVQTGLIVSQTPSFATGGDCVTDGPQMVMVGDNPGGRERVQVTPIGSPNINGPQGGITLNISAPLVDETIIDTIIPALQKAQRLNLA